MAASLAALVDQEIGQGACPDSVDVLSALLGESGAKGRDSLVVQGRGLAIRQGDWKFLWHPNADPVKALTYEKGPGQFELYNLRVDPGETMNLIDEFPDQADSMKNLLNTLRQR